MMMGAPNHAPIDLEIANICERFHVLPSQVLREDVRAMRRVLALTNEINRIRYKQKP